MIQRCPTCQSLTRIDGTPEAVVTCVSCGSPFHPQHEIKPAGRITLTQAHLKLPDIEEFVVLLSNIAADGVLEYEELQKLVDWLNNHTHLEIPAVKFMIDLMLRICADGKITEEEIFDVQLAIERVLPKEYRTRITEARKAAYYNQPASQTQLDAIAAISARRPVGLNRREASEMLEYLYQNPPASNRQVMFLRFWNRLDLITKTRREISAWMDTFIQGDHARWLAWEMFKRETGDDGSQRDPSCVPLGVGEKYAKKVYRQYS